ncbi:hypothetical protein BV25DRAFT_772405 [Artomyces pyxidatus]|uniref:Uncharacterized protein n=1 Tax=Artomyces pyxidatus TaxID=48021 RepID=A0ACB8SXW1_9AGAM|nr:hypothetical protein BV25DRAFT_772405 [Artomyces pyxidatus]
MRQNLASYQRATVIEVETKLSGSDTANYPPSLVVMLWYLRLAIPIHGDFLRDGLHHWTSHTSSRTPIMSLTNETDVVHGRLSVCASLRLVLMLCGMSYLTLDFTSCTVLLDGAHLSNVVSGSNALFVAAVELPLQVSFIRHYFGLRLLRRTLRKSDSCP